MEDCRQNGFGVKVEFQANCTESMACRKAFTAVGEAVALILGVAALEKVLA